MLTLSCDPQTLTVLKSWFIRAEVLFPSLLSLSAAVLVFSAFRDTWGVLTTRSLELFQESHWHFHAAQKQTAVLYLQPVQSWISCCHLSLSVGVILTRCLSLYSWVGLSFGAMLPLSLFPLCFSWTFRLSPEVFLQPTLQPLCSLPVLPVSLSHSLFSQST